MRRERKGSGHAQWMLIDLDAVSFVGRDVAFKYSEAYAPPEYMAVLLADRKRSGR